MASSYDSFSVGEFRVVMLTISVGSPWSEAEPGTTFEDWWEQQFHDKAQNLEMGNSDQKLKWVTGISNRAGVNGLMKPLKGLSEAARLQLSGRQPSGGSTVKVVLRPARASSCDVRLEVVGDKLCGGGGGGLPRDRAALQDGGKSGRYYAQPYKQHVGGLPPFRCGTRHP